MAFKATGNTLRDGPITAAYSFTGWPAVRAGATSEGMPVGVQIVGRPWRDDVVLAAMQSLEEELGGWQPPAIRESYRFESPDLRVFLPMRLFGLPQVDFPLQVHP